MLVTEMQLLQSRFDKYDDLIFRNRNWMIGLVTALVGAALTLKKEKLTLLAVIVAAFFYVVEIIWRGGYWFTYVARYRFIRDALNSGVPLDAISVYDLTNRVHGRASNAERFREALIRGEPAFFYLVCILGLLAVWYFLR